MLIGSPSLAQQSLNQAVEEQLINDCQLLLGDSELSTEDFGLQLVAICDDGSGGSTGSGASAGGAATTTLARSVILEERLANLRDEKDQQKLSLGLVSMAGAFEDQPRGFGWFITINHEDLDKYRTPLEEMYDSSIWNVTTGIDYRFDAPVITGVALSYNRWDGDTESGGDFRVESTGVFAYASLFSKSGAFVDATLGYAKKQYEYDRFVTWNDALNPDDPLTSGEVSGDYDGDEYSASLLAGYDHQSGRLTITPRVGISYVRTKNDSYQESGLFQQGDLVGNLFIVNTTPTGLELAYDSTTRKSLQSVIGLKAKWRVQTGGVTLLPQLSLDWHHEFEDDQRDIWIHFVQDNRDTPKRFSYNSDAPDRDFFYLSGGVTAIFDKDIQAFVNVRTMLDHDYYKSTAVSAGLRMQF